MVKWLKNEDVLGSTHDVRAMLKVGIVSTVCCARAEWR